MSTPIAIVGIGCAFPKAGDLSTYWSNVRDGVDAITDVPASHWDPADHYDADPSAPDKTYGRRGGFLDPVQFRPLDFGIAPRDIEATDTTQLLGLHCARVALDDAGYGEAGQAFDPGRAGVILGVTGALELVIPLGARLGHPIWRRALRDAGVHPDVAEDVVQRICDSYVPWQENSFPGLLGNVVAGRIANRLDLHGTNCVVDAACASSLSALHLAALELQAGRADMVLAGGLDTFNDVFMYTCFSKTPALSPTQDIRPFAQQADGTILGEGVGIVVLKRLADAESAGDRIYAVVRGIGSSSDGKGKAIYAPDAQGQARALRQAYAIANVDPRTVELIEAHGTGTRVGDATEAAGLTEVFGDGDSWCALGSVKSMIGHTKAAAGVAGLIKVAMALHRRVIPPTLKVEQPNDAVAPGQTPFYVNTLRRPWLRGDHPRRAGVSAFGFGGSNFHCVLEEHDDDDEGVDWDGQTQIFALSGADREQLLARLREIDVDADWTALRRAAGASRAVFDPAAQWRLTFVAERDGTSLRELVASAATLEGERSVSPQGIALGHGPARGRLGALFPGQGAQYVGMLRDLACTFGCVREALTPELAARIYPQSTFGDQVRREQTAALRATDVAQPAIGAVSLGALRVLESFGLHPEAAVGHSYGELVALAAAGALPAQELESLSTARGGAMARLGGDRGGMLAVAADLETVQAAVRDLPLVVANRNAPRQMVLSGSTAAIERAQALLTEAGHRCTRLDVAAAFHSPLVAEAKGPFSQALRDVDFLPPRFAVYANATGTTYPADAADIRSLLAEQLVSPVEFIHCVRQMADDGVDTFVEIGPGRRLSGLVADILADRSIHTMAIDASSGRRRGVADLARVLGALAAWGHAVELARWDPAATQLPEPRTDKTLTVSVRGAHPKPEPPARPPVAVDRPIARPAVSSNQETLDALLRLQEQTAELHRRFLEGQEEAVRVIAALASGGAASTFTSTSTSTAGVNDHVDVRPTTTTTTTTTTFTSASASAASVLLEVVAAKTGYPVEMLELSMGLDSDLGIDSIKRVEILSALSERLPDLPKVAPEQLGDLRTLGDIAEFLGGAPASLEAAPIPSARPTSAPSVDVTSMLLDVVAEKTGYPAEVLELNMGLDADLGIDSIKRVEILSALAERLPEAPVVAPEALSELRTLGEVAAYLGEHEPISKPPARSLMRLEVGWAEVPEAGPAPAPEGLNVAVLGDPDDDLVGELAAAIGGCALGWDAPLAGVDGLVIVASTRPPQDVCHRAFRAVKGLGSSLRLLATVSRLGGRFGLEGLEDRTQPRAGGLAGLVKTLGHEWPDVQCRAFDLDPSLPAATAASRLSRWLWTDGPVEIGIGATGAGTPALHQVEPASSGGVRFGAQDVVLITGGARGVTAAVARALGDQGAQLVLVGRSAEPGREEPWLAAASDEAAINKALLEQPLAWGAGSKPTPRELQAQSARVLAGREIRATLADVERAVYRQVDVRDEAAVAGLVQWVQRELGPITGLVHGAGVLADRRIEDKTDEDFDRVFGTKVDGLSNLLAALPQGELRGVVLFSSSTARFGRAGQLDYAMANEVLNKAGQSLRRRHPACRVLSIAWGPWDGGMVTPALKRVFASEGIETIELDLGAAQVIRELAGTGPTELVVLGGGSRLPVPDRQPSPDPPTVYEREVSVPTHPVLGAHVIGGRAVLPTVLMLEWMAHGALHGHPGLKFVGCDDLQICRGVRLADGDRIRLRVCASEATRDGEAFVVGVQLCSGGNNGHRVVHAKTRIRLAQTLSAGPGIELPVLSPYRRPMGELYGSALFHGELMQGIDAIEGLDRRGVIARCSSAAAPKRWMDDPARRRWITDPLALDCGMQAVIAWSFEQFGLLSLPAGWGSLRQHAAFPKAGTTVLASIKQHTEHEAIADLHWLDASGAVVASVIDYRCTIDPSLRAAFDRNQLERLRP